MSNMKSIFKDVMRFGQIILLCLFTICLSITPDTARAQSSIHFGESVILLQLPGEQLIMPHISPYGSYIVARIAIFEMDKLIGRSHVVDTKYYGWDLRQVSLDVPLVHVPPTHELQLGRAPDFAFHPDERFLAIATDAQVQLFTLPSFELYKSIPVMVDESLTDFYEFRSNRLAWSLDGQILAILRADEIVAWNVETGTLERHSLPEVYDRVVASKTGWVLRPWHGSPTLDLVVCTKHLETCDAYQGSFLVSSDGQAMLARSADSISELTREVLHLQDNGEYKVAEEIVLPNDQCRRPSLAPLGGFVAFVCSVEEGWSFQDISQGEVIPNLPWSYGLDWFSDGEHIAWFAGVKNFLLRLYEVGETEPLDEVDWKDIPGLGDVNNLFYDRTPEGVVDVSADGRWVLVDFGWASLIVPIEYE